MPGNPSVLIPLAPGVEEMEAVIVIDTLRRAGWDVFPATLSDDVVEASRGVKLLGDGLLSDALSRSFDCVVIPGGMGGVENLLKSKGLSQFLQTHASEGWLAAICAGPLVLQDAGLLKGKIFTSHPGVADKFLDGKRVNESVVVDHRLVTSQGPGTALDFALKLIELIESKEKALQVAGPMCKPEA